MTEAQDAVIIVKEQIIQKIVHLRDEKVILDIHLAELYGVETRALKQAVRRNKERFPADDFMFELTKNTLGAPSPLLFMRTFVALRKVSYNYKEIMEILMDMRSQYDAQFEEVFKALEHLIHPPQEPRPRIGFRRKDEQD
jgi:hypothetical protein